MVFQAFSSNFPTCGAPNSCPFRLSFHSQQLSPPWVHAPNPTFQHPAPLHNRRHTTQAGVCRVVTQTKCTFLTLSCLPQTIHCILPKSHKGPFLSQLISPPRGGFSECGNLSSPSASRQVCWSLFRFLFSFFHATQLCRDFSYLFRCPKIFH